MDKRRMSMPMMLSVILLMAVPSFAKTKEQKQADVRKNAQQTLTKLYTARGQLGPPSKEQPGTQLSAISV